MFAATRPVNVHRTPHDLLPPQRAAAVAGHGRFPRETQSPGHEALFSPPLAHVALSPFSPDLNAAFSRLSARISCRALASSCANAPSAALSCDARLTEARSSPIVVDRTATADTPRVLAVSWFWELSGRTDGLAFPFALR